MTWCASISGIGRPFRPGLFQTTGNVTLIQTNSPYHRFIEQVTAIKGDRPVTGLSVPGQSDFTDDSYVQLTVQGFGKRDCDRQPSGRYGKHQRMLQIKLSDQPGQHLPGLVSIGKESGPVTEFFDLENLSTFHSDFASQLRAARYLLAHEMTSCAIKSDPGNSQPPTHLNHSTKPEASN
jgi:hypothetical protein